MKTAIAFVLFTVCNAHLLRSQIQTSQEPDTSCGKGFDSLVGGSQDYFKTASKTLWNHAGRNTDNETFATEIECWFANMCTQKCGGLESQASKRKAKLTKVCKDPLATWIQVWKLFTKPEFAWYKKEYPAKELDPEKEGADISDRQALWLVKELNKKELLCLTLFTIDDECVKYPHIRFDPPTKEGF